METQYQNQSRSPFVQILTTTVRIPTANVLTLNGVKYLLIPAVAGKQIQVISAVCGIVFNSVAYTTHVDLQLITDTASLYQRQTVNALNANATRYLNMEPDQFGTAAGSTQLIANKGLYAFVPAGNPAAGNSDVTITVNYILV